VFAELITQLARGATVVTPNRRLSAAVRRGFDKHASAQGQAAWVAADVLPWNAWLERIFRDASVRGKANRLLMSHWQARALWRRVIADAPEAQGLLQVDTTADLALQAWELTHAWRLLPALQTMPLSDEARAFLRWARAYETICARENLTDLARLSDLVGDLLLTESLATAPRLIAFGFDALTPQQEAVLEALRSRGIEVDLLAQSGEAGQAASMRYPDVLHEVRAAALWARGCIAANPQARVGVVVPELNRLRATITRIFEEVLQPDAALHPGWIPPRPWNVSLGVPLSDWPLAHAALLLLELASGPLSIHRIGVLLRSPFVGGAESERNARALLDGRLRRLGDPHIRLDGLIRIAGAEGHTYSCGMLADRLAALRACLRELPASAQRVSFWGPALQSLLSAMQWPGERELNSEEYQTFKKWKELIAGLAQLDLVSAPVRLASAVGMLRRLAVEELFQPETPDVPIQVLGVLESAQLEFDHLWVLGLSDETWPRPARPNPLLPLELQRSRGVPRASAEWELAFALRAQANWLRAAPRIAFSYHGTEGDQVLGPSPLLAGLPETTLAQLSIEALPDWRVTAQAAAEQERFTDWQGRPLPEGSAFRGGARLLQNQSACPFRAFAVHRLGAASLDHPHDGLDARDRGILLHAALAELWSELTTRQRLDLIPRDELASVITRAVDRALARLHRTRASSFQTRFLELERARLVELLEEWLRIELQRGEFRVVACEEQAAVNIAGLVLSLRLDRVDSLAQGGELLIDYKTGPSSIAMWMGERPDEPQLPLYHLARPVLPEAVAFAQVRRGECGLSGLSADLEVAEGIARLSSSRFANAFRDWPALLAHWRVTLEALAIRFRSGAAPVDPKKGALTCRNCDLSTLCRVSEVVDRGSPTPAEESAGE
jgi:ATP-dependent helicase/nuclease subunit B